MSEGAVGVLILALVPLGWASYVLPAIIAFRRRHPNRWLILAVNVMLGATGIGWAVALVWAFHVAHRSDQDGGSHGGESGLNLFANDVRTVRVMPTTTPPAAIVATRPSPGTALQEIERLAMLRTEGHLTESEYATLKANVLHQL